MDTHANSERANAPIFKTGPGPDDVAVAPGLLEGWRVATFLTVGFLLVLFSIVYVKKVSVQRLGFSYDKIVSKKQYWRVLTSVLCHDEFGHVFLNCWFLWTCGGNMEIKRGSIFFVQYSVLLVLLSKALNTGISYNLIHRWRMPTQSHFYCLGCSELVLGWILVASIQSEQRYLQIPNPALSLKIPMHLAPYLFILVMPLASTRNNAASSAAGLSAGMLIGLGFFDWLLDSYWFMCLMVWIVCFFCSSLDDLAGRGASDVESLHRDLDAYDAEAGGVPSSFSASGESRDVEHDMLTAEQDTRSSAPSSSVEAPVSPRSRFDGLDARDIV